MFDFKDMLAKYEQLITIIKPGTDGHYDDDTGQWVPGEDPEEIETFTPILPLTDDDLQHDEGGTYTREDRKVYIHQELGKGWKVKIGDDEFTVNAGKDYSHYASGLRIYILVRKGAAG